MIAASLVEVSKNLLVNFQHFFVDIFNKLLTNYYKSQSFSMGMDHTVNFGDPHLCVIIVRDFE